MPVDILVCNLTRFGDLIQTQPLFNDLHKAGYRTGLVCLPNFLSAARLLQNVDEIWSFPMHKFFLTLEGSWTSAIGQVLDHTRKISQEAQARQIVNLTPTIPARLLTKLLAGKNAQISGFSLDDDGFGVNSNVWASFLAVAAKKRANSPFNVADLLRNTALIASERGNGEHTLAPPSPEAVNWAKTTLQNLHDKYLPAGFVAFQLGASEDSRRWPVEHFAKLGEILWQKAKLLPVITGSKSELHLAEKYQKLADTTHPFHITSGQTDFQQLAALLCNCELLVSNDTGTMHLASGQNVPILAIFLATAQAWDTAPLMPDSCCLEPALNCHPCAFGTNCQDHECRQQISPEHTAEIILSWKKTGRWQAGSAEGKEYKMWITGKDESGLNIIRPATKTASSPNSRWMMLLRKFWSQIIDKLEHPEARKIFNLNSLKELSTSVDPALINSLKQVVQLLETIVELGKIQDKNPRSTELILKNLSRVQLILDKYPELSTIAGFFQELCAAPNQEVNVFISQIDILSKGCKELCEYLDKKGIKQGQT